MDHLTRQHHGPPSCLSPKRPRLRLLWWGLATACMAGLSACSDGDVVTPNAPAQPANLPTLRGAVTASAAAAIGPQGEFAIAPRTMPAGSISEEAAIRLATAFLGTVGAQFRATLEEDAGRAIDLAQLHPWGRVHFAETPYANTPTEAPIPRRAALAPAYIITFADEEGPAVLMSVSVHFQNAHVANGQFRWDGRHGNQLTLAGLAEDGLGTQVATPEDAARLAAAATGALVVTPPELVWWGRPYSKLMASWRVVLNKAVDVRLSSGTTTSTRTLYVDRTGDFRAADPAHPLTAVSLRDRAFNGTPLTVGLNRKLHGHALVPSTVIKEEQ